MKTNLTAAALPYANCSACPLNRRRNPILGNGDPDANLAVIADAPHYTEVRGRRPMCGRSGDIYNSVLEQNDSHRSKVWTTHAVLCQTQDGNKSDVPPPSGAIAACRPRLVKELELLNPKMVLTLGETAMKSTLRTRKTIGEMQGVVEYVDDIHAPILPTYSFGVAVGKGKKAESQFEDILSAVKRGVFISDGRLSLMDRNEQIPVRHITTVAQAERTLNAILDGKAGFKLAIDVETSGLSIIDSDLLQVAIGNDDKAVVIEYDVLKNPALNQKMASLLKDERFTWIIHNMSFDRQRFEKYFNAVPANDIDTMCLALGLTEHKGKVGLKTLSREWLNAPYYEDEVHQYLGVGKSGWENVPRPVLAKYAGLDVVYTSRVEPILNTLCEEEGTISLVRNILEPAQRVFGEVETLGVLVDRTYIAELESIWLPKIEESRTKIQEYAKAHGWVNRVPDRKVRVYEPVTETKRRRVNGKMQMVTETKDKFVEWRQTYRDEPLNPSSPPQVAEFVYKTLGLKEVRDEKSGNLTTGKEFRAAHPNHEFTEMLEEFSLINHMMTTYVRGIADDISSDGRVHPNIDIRGAVTGRLAMHNPPLQTIPRANTLKGDFDSIKRIFLPSPGHVWVSTDFAQLEVRCAWFLSGDDVLGNAVMSGDFHKAMAAKVFNKPESEVTDDERQAAKVINFGILYGMSALGLSERLGIGVETAQVMIDDYFEGAPKFREWYFQQHANALTTGRSVSPFGRVRRWNLITRENRQSVLNQSVNFPVQSLASDLNLIAFMKVHEELKRRRLGRGLFLVHDSIEAEVREGREAEAIQVIRDIMTTWPIDNPSGAILDVETSVGSNWGNTKVWRE